MSICECWFLDVGQGASNVIYLGDGRAIVIDCGPLGSSQTIQFLNQNVHTIEALIISHNDSDHDSNISEILGAYRKRIKRIFFLKDRPAKKIKIYKAVGLFRSENKEDFPAPEYIEASKKIPLGNDIVLEALYPNIMDTLDAEGSGTRRPNRTSGILKLKCGSRNIVFSSDATIEAWESLASEIQSDKPLKCDIMTIPHHGGSISKNKDSEENCQKKLYSEIIKPDYGIISVGTINRCGHPCIEAIMALKESGVKVLCTQMTHQCSEDLESIRDLRQSIQRPAQSKRKVFKTRAGGKSKHVACYGTVVVQINTDEVKISNLDRYERDMGKFANVREFRPLCQQ